MSRDKRQANVVDCDLAEVVAGTSVYLKFRKHISKYLEYKADVWIISDIETFWPYALYF